MKNQSDIMMKMFKYLGSMIVDLQDGCMIKYCPADEQLRYLRLASSYGEDIDKQPLILRVTKLDIGSDQISRETVSRNISLFKSSD